jgi:hypothetical protein
MAQTLAAKLARLKLAPLVPDAILAALQGQGDLPDDVDALCNRLMTEAAAVAGLRARLADVPPTGSAKGCVLL